MSDSPRISTALLVIAVSLSTVAQAADSDAPTVVFTPEMVFSERVFESSSALIDVSRGGKRVPDAPTSLRPMSKRFLKVHDPGDESSLDFGVGDTLTIEAWVRLAGPPSDAFPYIVGKGRTHTGKGKTTDANQNYALRLSGSGKSQLSFLWMDTDGTEVSQSAHRWTSSASVPVDGRWHHVALTYTFGSTSDVSAWIDGQKTDGVWDMRGRSTQSPVTDNDDLWVGASMGGGHLFPGEISELAIYRGALSDNEIAARTVWVDTQEPDLPWTDHPVAAAAGETVAGVYDIPARGWFSKPDFAEPTFRPDGFALTRLPFRYNGHGVIDDRPRPAMLRLVTKCELPAGQYRVLLRSLDAARLYAGDKLVAECQSMPKLNGSAHNKVYQLTEPPLGVVQAPVAHRDVQARFDWDGGEVQFEAYRLLGGDRRVVQLGEFLVAIAAGDEPFQVLGTDWQPDDRNWQALLDDENRRLATWNHEARRLASNVEQARWNERHSVAAGVARTQLRDFSELGIDEFINRQLQENSLDPTGRIGDEQFMRRVTLDTLGRGPTLAELDRYGLTPRDPQPLDRSRVIEDLLASNEWADHWTSYFMDVLAENPALTKPTLNNSGPFRRYLHDALYDNWGMDRFVTNLIRMSGSRYEGGPAGFGMASQNDVPMAAKAHVIGTAFLGVEMKCARCHDAPGHPFEQSDLFSIAAMLNRKPLEVPATSSIPATPEEIAEMVVSVSIRPGEEIAPAWPFPDLSDLDGIGGLPSDSRERLARMVTDPANLRFREVMVNRIWTRLIGVGLVESTGDWTDRETPHPELLRWLALQMLASGDDLKHVARLILNSDLYQRAVVPGLSAQSLDAQEFRGPVRRRLTAEQVVDSLHTATDRPMRTEIQSFSPDGVQERSKFFEMGRATRAWQLVCTASERDRQSLSLPVVDSLNELLQSYGWRPQRQEPSDRGDMQPTPLTPMMLAHGPAASRLLDATPGSLIANVGQLAATPTEVVHTLTRATLGRRATTEEISRFVPLLTPGFEERLTDAHDPVQPVYRHRVTWRNHFDPQSEVLVQQRWKQIESGDPPTQTLTASWRERAEDVLWVLVNSPEFAWVP